MFTIQKNEDVTIVLAIPCTFSIMEDHIFFQHINISISSVVSMLMVWIPLEKKTIGCICVMPISYKNGLELIAGSKPPLVEKIPFCL